MTGASGHVGYRTLTTLLNHPAYKDYRVRCLVRNVEAFKKSLALPPTAEHKSRIELVQISGIDAPGVYDEPIKGVSYVIHLASRLGSLEDADYDKLLIQPAVRGTVGLLEAAHKEPKVKRIVITASIVSFGALPEDGTIITGNSYPSISFSSASLVQ